MNTRTRCAVIGMMAVTFFGGAASSLPGSERLANDPVQPTSLASVLPRLGFTPEVIAAAGIDAQQFTVCAGNLSVEMNTAAEPLRVADAAFRARQSEREEMLRKYRAGHLDAGGVINLRASDRNLILAERHRTALIRGLRAKFAASLEVETRKRLIHIATLTPPGGDPIATLSVNAGGAYRHQQPASGDAAVISAARNSLNSNLQSVRLAWLSATGLGR